MMFALALPMVADSVDLPAIQSFIVAADGPGGYYDREYRRQEAHYWQKIPGWMEQAAAHREARAVLDIGCGYGTLLAYASVVYSDTKGYCIDLTDFLKPPVATKYRLTFARLNVELEPISWSGFDVVIMTEVLEHFNFQPLPTLQKIYAAMNHGAVLFLSTPDERDWGRQTKYYGRLADLPMPDPHIQVRDDHIWIYSEKELSSLLRDAGFRIKRLEHAPGNGNRHFK
jgi:SAM-dependent methyltransferase